MFNPWLSFGLKAWQVGLEAQGRHSPAPSKRCMFSPKSSPAILPCLPRPAQQPPKGAGWIHEIKHDGFRIIARRDAKGVRLFTRNGYDFTARFPKIADAISSLPVRSCVVDGEAIVVDERGLSVFDALHYRLRDLWMASRKACVRSASSGSAEV